MNELFETFKPQNSIIKKYIDYYYLDIKPNLNDNVKFYFNKKVNFDQEWMLKNFQKNQDREHIWIHKIELKI